MAYYFTTTLGCSFEEAVKRTTAALQAHKFGVLTTIDLHEKFKEKLGKEFRRYRILGACSPPHAYAALQHEDKIGTMLPCNVIVQERAPNEIEVSAVDPVASMLAIRNEALGAIAREVQAALKATIEDLGS